MFLLSIFVTIYTESFFTDGSHSLHNILDELCFYDLLNHENLTGISAIHWMILRGDYITAKHLINLNSDEFCNDLQHIADLALLLCCENKMKVRFIHHINE